MNDDDIKADRAIIAAADYRAVPNQFGRVVDYPFTKLDLEEENPWYYVRGGECRTTDGLEVACRREEVAEFVAAACTRWPEALDEIGRLRADVEVFKRQRDHARQEAKRVEEAHAEYRTGYWKLKGEISALRDERDDSLAKYQATATALAEALVERDAKIDRLYDKTESSDAFKLKIATIDLIRKNCEDMFAREREVLEDAAANATRERNQLQQVFEQLEDRYADVTDKRGALMTENAALKARQQELLATIVRVTNETPFPDEIKTWQGSRAAMLAEIGTLRAERDEWRRRAEAHGCDTERGDIDCG